MQAKARAALDVCDLANDTCRDIVLFINDFYPEYGAAFKKLSKHLNRPLHGILLIDSTAKKQNRNHPDTEHLFEEVVCDFSDVGALRAVIKQFEDRVLLISSSAESSQLDFRRVLPHVPYLLGPTEQSLEWATHKGKMRQVLGGYNPNLVPKVRQISSPVESEVKSVIAELGFPMIVKPTGLSGGSLIAKVNDEYELRRALHKAFALLEEAYDREGGNGEPGIIVEEFIQGDMYCVDGYVNEYGKVWLLPLLRCTIANELGHEGFYTYRNETYFELTDKEKAAGLEAAEQSMRALGLRSCLAHIELFKTESGWKIIELGARPGGTRQEIYQVSYGVDHAFNELLIKLGLEPEISDKLITHSMVINICSEEEGVVESISGLEEARQHPSAHILRCFIKSGDTVKLNTNGGTAIVSGLISNTDPHQLRQDSELIRSMVKVKTRQPVAKKAYSSLSRP